MQQGLAFLVGMTDRVLPGVQPGSIQCRVGLLIVGKMRRVEHTHTGRVFVRNPDSAKSTHTKGARQRRRQHRNMDSRFLRVFLSGVSGYTSKSRVLRESRCMLMYICVTSSLLAFTFLALLAVYFCCSRSTAAHGACVVWIMGDGKGELEQVTFQFCILVFQSLQLFISTCLALPQGRDNVLRLGKETLKSRGGWCRQWSQLHWRDIQFPRFVGPTHSWAVWCSWRAGMRKTLGLRKTRVCKEGFVGCGLTVGYGVS